MELIDLGFDCWFEEKLKESAMLDCSVARVTAVDRDSYLVRNETSEVPAEITGKLLFSAESNMDLPAVGDWVLIQYYDSNTLAIIHGILPRKSVLRRKAAGRRIEYQLIATNIDVAFIVQSCDYDFNVRRLERYLVMVNEGHIKPVFLMTKSDLVGEEFLEQRILKVREANIECEVIALSNRTGWGLDHVRNTLLRARTYCLLGSSGVGKTTLLNHLVGKDAFRTNSVREKDGKGRHTTGRRQLIVLNQGAMLIDTPGMRELGNIGAGEAIDESFSDIRELSGACRFSDCTHTSEVGCAVLSALEKGELSETRYESYLKLIKESEFHEMSYSEKRQRDKKFGQFVKSVKKQIKKR
ncbi:MAG: ribosome small subunit-dependent GTPase A [Chloroflexota bacterium]|nr:ribosome small subunit-dependent GTPase A [Chloroflexota bacterium]